MHTEDLARRRRAHATANGAIWALGTMSGTSLDGVDAAFLKSDGITIETFGPHSYRRYTDVERDTIRAALGQWQEGPNVAAASEVVEAAHAEILGAMIKAHRELAGDDVLIGFHGQTLAHAPRTHGTHQSGDGRVLAEYLQRTVVWDFRTADVRLGGQGAPLAPYFHFACARWAGLAAPVAFLNLGGVGNVTWVDPRLPKPEAAGAVLAFDTGPANAPINDLMRARLGKDVDAGGALAAHGSVEEPIVDRFLDQSYFMKIPPKSLDRNDFNDLLVDVASLSDADACATLTACVAASVARGMEHFPDPVSALYVTGGGRHNATLMTMLAARTGCTVLPVEELGLNGDMLEAQAFAYLAIRVARGLPTSGPLTTGVAATVGGGQISRPQG
ncbi:anhydro-N-acetylmuramic acid kinase [Albirhodobacter sp. R86504]|uniref:anhydro-N-acetylmuramic acid kinase n=1 Tax=Albirhodobacter sp. R86504 TaxID=3093848 RepID=UPI0036725673